MKLLLGASMGALVTLFLSTNYRKSHEVKLSIGIGLVYTSICVLIALKYRLSVLIVWGFITSYSLVLLYQPQPVYGTQPIKGEISVTLLSALDNERRYFATEWMREEGLSGQIYSKPFVRGLDNLNYTCKDELDINIVDINYLFQYSELLSLKSNQKEKWVLILEDDVEPVTSYPFLYYIERYINLNQDADFIFLDNRAVVVTEWFGGGMVGVLVRRDSIDKIVGYFMSDPCLLIKGKTLALEVILRYICVHHLIKCKAAPILR